jgi:hypothetical protein
MTEHATSVARGISGQWNPSYAIGNTPFFGVVAERSTSGERMSVSEIARGAMRSTIEVGEALASADTKARVTPES